MNPDQEINLGDSSSSQNPNTAGLNRPSSFNSSYSAMPRASVLYSRFQPSNELPGIIRLLLKLKLVKNEKQAEKLILLLILLLIVAATALFVLAFQEPAVNI